MNNAKTIADGIWPTMLTLYKEDNTIDYDATERLIEWYIGNGVTGIFAMCQSSEMFFLDDSEKLSLIDFILKKVNRRVNVVVGGTVQNTLEEQILYAKCAARLGPDAVVFLRNRLSDDLAGDLKKIISGMPADMPLGIYECPYPNKRHLTDEEVSMLVNSGRFVFLKDTVCDAEVMKRRARLAEGSAFKLYNANAATFYESINFGYNGYSGIMANFHPDLYSWVFNHRDDKRCEFVEKALGVMSVIECRGYPICCKAYLRDFEGFPITNHCRSTDYKATTSVNDELKGIKYLSDYIRNQII